MLFIGEDFDVSEMSFKGVESTTLKEGDYRATITTVETTTSEDKAQRFKEKTPQLLVVFEAEGKTVKKWYNLIGFKRFDANELAGTIETISKNSKLLKSVGVKDAKEFAKLPLEEKIEICFDSMQADENDPEGKVHYAIFKGTGNRIIDEPRSEKAKSILGRTCVLAGIAENGEELNISRCDELVGQEVGIRVARNNANQLKVEVISLDEVSEID